MSNDVYDDFDEPNFMAQGHADQLYALTRKLIGRYVVRPSLAVDMARCKFHEQQLVRIAEGDEPLCRPSSLQKAVDDLVDRVFPGWQDYDAFGLPSAPVIAPVTTASTPLPETQAAEEAPADMPQDTADPRQAVQEQDLWYFGTRVAEWVSVQFLPRGTLPDEVTERICSAVRGGVYETCHRWLERNRGLDQAELTRYDDQLPISPRELSSTCRGLASALVATDHWLRACEQEALSAQFGAALYELLLPRLRAAAAQTEPSQNAPHVSQ